MRSQIRSLRVWRSLCMRALCLNTCMLTAGFFDLCRLVIVRVGGLQRVRTDVQTCVTATSDKAATCIRVCSNVTRRHCQHTADPVMRVRRCARGCVSCPNPCFKCFLFF